MSYTQQFIANDEQQQLALGQALAKVIKTGTVIYLTGDLGAGKTTLTRGFLQGLGYQGTVKSPTYTLVEPYDFSQVVVFHFDLYRFSHDSEWAEAGFRDYFNAESVCLVEWPEMAGNTLPLPDLDIHLSICGEGRRATLVANSESGRTCLSALKSRGSFS